MLTSRDFERSALKIVHHTASLRAHMLRAEVTMMVNLLVAKQAMKGLSENNISAQGSSKSPVYLNLQRACSCEIDDLAMLACAGCVCRSDTGIMSASCKAGDEAAVGGDHCHTRP